MKSLEILENLQREIEKNRDNNVSSILEQLDKIKEISKPPTYNIPQKDTIGREIYTLLIKR